MWGYGRGGGWTWGGAAVVGDKVERNQLNSHGCQVWNKSRRSKIVGNFQKSCAPYL